MPDPVTAIAGAVEAFFGTVKPVVEEHYAQKYEEEHKQRIREYQNVMSLPDGDVRAGSIGTFVRGLCDSAGTPTGSLSGELISIPVEYLQAFVVNTSESIRDEQRLARLTFKLS